uniref:Halogenase n=1 Tax=Mycena chlorophos TaxID=658473 RepID=A0ABQ0L952_MYCCL|nr:predicted protein [Mycena chlorophos]
MSAAAPTVPSSTKILVIGGGPSGSMCASALAREGFEVTILEKDFFPRYHIGESMLPSCRPFLKFVGAEEKIAKHGFAVKVGAAVKLNQFKREGYTDFITPDPNRAAWNVVRSEFDEILLRHAVESGAKVFEGHYVTDIQFAEPESSEERRPISADWRSKTAGTEGRITFDFVVDCSGRTGLLSTKYLKTRKFNSALRNVAFWSYWKGAGLYGAGTRRENAPWFEALTDESGWAWFIPLHDGVTSVGIVMKEDLSKEKKAKSGNDLTQHYLDQMPLAPGMMKLLGCEAKMIKDVMQAGDYSYSSEASRYAGPGYRICGDAGAFIDPFFSSGVHLAFVNAISAAATISSSIRGECSEEQAIKFHSEKTGTSYTRFMVVVLSVYRQITSQQTPVLSDIDEDNFDRAFDFLRPVIQGIADADRVGAGVTETHVQATMDFCEHALGGTNPEMAEEVAQRVNPDLLDRSKPIMSMDEVTESVGDDDEDAKAVVMRVNARKAINGMYDWEENFRDERLSGGYVVRLERGRLGIEVVA